MYVPDPRCLFTRIQEPRRRSPESAPAGRTSLMLEIPCQPGDAVWERDDGELTARCLAELDLLGIRVGGALAGSFSTRVVHGYPLFRLGYERHRARLLAAVGDFANLVSCGRQGTFRYLFMDTAMEMGLEAARQVAERQREPARIFSLHDEPALLEARALSA
jgi:protoporphyrinogen oxidase